MTLPGIPKDHHPGTDYRRPGYPGPSSNPSSAGTTTGARAGGVGTTGGGPGGGYTVGKDFSSRGNATGTPDNEAPNVSPRQPRNHLNSGPGGSAAPGCGLTGAGRPPYCG
jgi:hypothetical protein